MSGRRPTSPDLQERLSRGTLICAEGYLFEFERRGYLQAGPYVPEIVLEHPEMVRQLHRDFVHAGSDVVEAFTYYANREKLRLIGSVTTTIGSPRCDQFSSVVARVPARG